MGSQQGRNVSEMMTIEFEAPRRMTAHIEEYADGVLVVTTDLVLDRSA